MNSLRQTALQIYPALSVALLTVGAMIHTRPQILRPVLALAHIAIR